MNGTASRNVAPYIVAGIVSAFLIIIAYAMFFVPKMNESKALVDQAATAHTNNIALTAKADRLAATAKNLGPLRAQVDEFTGSFPAAAEQQNMMDAVTNAAASTGVTVTTLSPKVPEAKKDGTPAAAPAAATTAQAGTELPGAAPVPKAAAAQVAAAPSAQLGTVTLKIDGNGSLEAVQAFLVKIETLKRPMLLHEVQIEKLDSGYHVMLNGETFMAAPLVAPADSK